MKLYAKNILWSCQLLERIIVVFISFMVCMPEEELQNYCITHLTKRSDTLNKKHLGCKKGEANHKQQLSEYSYIATYTCD